jgi:Ca2+-binding RTX toxin-like protein
MEFTLHDADGDTVEMRVNGVWPNHSDVLPSGSVTLSGTGDVRMLEVHAKAAGYAVINLELFDGTYSVLGPFVEVRVGTNAADQIDGGGYSDLIFGRDGRDTLRGGPGNDLLCGGRDRDELFAGDGDDWVFGQGSPDTLKGKAGNDNLFGGRGDDQMFGGSGDDTLAGGNGADFFSGGADADTASDFDAGAGDTEDGTIP